MKLFDYFTEKHKIEDYFFACYYDHDQKCDMPSFLVRKGKDHVYDICNKKDLTNMKFRYVKSLTYYAREHKTSYLSLFKAKKLAKKHADKYTDFVIDEINGHVDKFGLKTKVERPIDLSSAIILEENDFEELN